jgi:hypothetical protein
MSTPQIVIEKLQMTCFVRDALDATKLEENRAPEGRRQPQEQALMITGTITIKVDYSDGEKNELFDVQEALEAVATQLKDSDFAVPSALMSASAVRTDVKVRFYAEVQTKLPLPQETP